MALLIAGVFFSAIEAKPSRWGEAYDVMLAISNISLIHCEKQRGDSSDGAKQSALLIARGYRGNGDNC